MSRLRTAPPQQPTKRLQASTHHAAPEAAVAAEARGWRLRSGCACGLRTANEPRLCGPTDDDAREAASRLRLGGGLLLLLARQPAAPVAAPERSEPKDGEADGQDVEEDQQEAGGPGLGDADAIKAPAHAGAVDDEGREEEEDVDAEADVVEQDVARARQQLRRGGRLPRTAGGAILRLARRRGPQARVQFPLQVQGKGGVAEAEEHVHEAIERQRVEIASADLLARRADASQHGGKQCQDSRHRHVAAERPLEHLRARSECGAAELADAAAS
mmetsp:Transcript_141668/g.440439  ORF Transcript_141668/g.440439 Transcript_141668/m.440439 type:complete len:273 (+) Transcript_141668:79-897(+)